ncbi:MAG TPA: hypothetical protein VEJ41_02960 [Candidatus Acidoferrales bacterium]|nr:hypothetical protein [Candidatus Acidoferrales bacterium]
MIQAEQAQEVERIRERMRSSFATSYLTLLSIIQGTALATLFLKVDSLISKHSFHAPQLVMAVGLMLTVILFWNQYLMGVELYYWPSQLFDAFIPFSLGIAEFSAILGLEHGGVIMLVAFGAFFALAVLAFEHQYWQLRRSAGPDAFVHVLTSGFRQLDVLSCAMSSVIFLGTAWLLARYPTNAGDLIAGWVVVAVATGQALREIYFWRLVQQRLASAA